MGPLAQAAVVLLVGGAGRLAAGWVNLSIGAPVEFPGVASLLLGGLPFALVAGMIRGRRTAAVALAVALLAGGSLAALVAAGPRLRADAAVVERFAADRDLTYELDVPGYGSGTRNGFGWIMWLDTAERASSMTRSGNVASISRPAG